MVTDNGCWLLAAMVAAEATLSRRASSALHQPQAFQINARTVKYHLHKVYANLGISSRSRCAALAASRSGWLPGRDGHWTVQSGGRECRPPPTRLDEAPAACRHRSSAAGFRTTNGRPLLVPCTR